MTGAELDRDVRRELSTLGAESGREVARHLVMAGRWLEADPELALAHAIVARRRAARLAVVREAVGLAAYRCGQYAEALAELRTVRRLTGSDAHLAIMADCERGLGRPERALAAVASAPARLDVGERVELLIVAAGARWDLGEPEAALVTLEVPELRAAGQHAWLARLRMAYSDALSAVGRDDEARVWRQLAAKADVAGSGLEDLWDDGSEPEFVDLVDGELVDGEPVEDGLGEAEPGAVEPAEGEPDVVEPAEGEPSAGGTADDVTPGDEPADGEEPDAEQRVAGEPDDDGPGAAGDAERAGTVGTVETEERGREMGQAGGSGGQPAAEESARP